MPLVITTNNPESLLKNLQESLLEWNETRRDSQMWRYNETEQYFQRISKGQTELPDVREEHKFNWEVKPGALQLRFEHQGAYDSLAYTAYYVDMSAHLLRKHRKEFSSMLIRFDVDELDVDRD